MASPEGLAERSAPLLPPGSEVRHAFICQTAPHFGFFILNWATGLAMPWIKYRCVAVADDGTYVLDSPRLSGGAKPTSVISALPRRTRLGPVSGRWGEITILGRRHWVKKLFRGRSLQPTPRSASLAEHNTISEPLAQHS